MKRIPIFILLLLMIAALAVAAGCSDNGGEKAVESTERQITEEQSEEGDGKKFTVEGEEGVATIEVEEEDLTQETLGVPIYPGAALVPGSGLSSKTASGEKENTFIGAEFVTGDSMQKVLDWYTEVLGEVTEGAPEENIWLFQDQEGFLHLVKLEIEGDGVKITIFKMGGNVDIEF